MNMEPNAPLSPANGKSLGIKSRRSSITSISSRVQLDKDMVSNALDAIHSSASRTETLTTFNDFAAPPDPTNDSRFGNLYTRFKSTMTPTKGQSNSRYENPGLANTPSGAGFTLTTSDKPLGSNRQTRNVDVPKRPPSKNSRAIDQTPFEPLAGSTSSEKYISPERGRHSSPTLDNASVMDHVADERDEEHNRETSLASSNRERSESRDTTHRQSSEPRLGSFVRSLSFESQSQQHGSSGKSVLHEMKRKVLSRDFWMKDENAKVCFYCGDPFTTFRRKHHCRTCGQIYDAKCTVLTPGKPFGQPGRLRVCKTCESIILGEDSSDEEAVNEDEDFKALSGRQIRFSILPKIDPKPSQLSGPGSKPTEDISGADGNLISSQPLQRPLSSRRRTLALTGVEDIPALARPSSSRSLKSMTGRPLSSGHRPRKSRHQYMRSLSAYDANAPFHKGYTDGDPSEMSLPNFHADAIIDPDLAPFLSDDDSSDGESQSINASLNIDGDEERSIPTPAQRRGRPRPLSRSTLDLVHSGRENDALSMSSSSRQFRRQIEARRLSTSSMLNKHLGPRLIRSENLSADFNKATFGSWEHEVFSNSYESQLSTPFPDEDSHDRHFAADLDLSLNGLEHAKNLLHQFLSEANIEHLKTWKSVLFSILTKCTHDVQPDIQRGDNIDIRHYVKIKKTSGGSPRESRYISGVVFTKNIAVRGMPRSVDGARILLLGFPVEYARHEQHFMSLDPVIAQEKEFLRNLVNRIIALHPHVVLVQYNVAGLAIQYLCDAGIAVACNVKETVLHALSRCTQTRIISSMDRLTMDPKHLGSCGRFEVKTFVNKGSKKSYIIVSGCRKDLGCTIFLRGCDYKTLCQLKWITEFMAYVMYNLKLETSLMRDEFAFMSPPSEHTSTAKSSSKNALAINQSANSIEDTPKEKESIESKPHTIDWFNGLHPDNREDITPKMIYDKAVLDLQKRILSASPCVQLAEPYLLLKVREQERKVYLLNQLLEDTYMPQDTDHSEQQNGNHFELVDLQMVSSHVGCASTRTALVLHEIRQTEYHKAQQQFLALKKRWDSYIEGAREPFSPTSHQQIVVLFSMISLATNDACDGPDLLALDFYQEHDVDENVEADMPLGEYIERLCHQAQQPCIVGRCDKKMIDHHRQYVHGDGQVNVFLEKRPTKIRGMENIILMWSHCRICSQETPVTPMSSNTWKYSFAKYLELTFWGQHLHTRADFCEHDVHKSHSRYFGFEGYAVRVEYDPIIILDIIVPKGVVEWKVEKDIELKNAEFQRIEDRMQRFITSVRARIKSIRLDSVPADKAERCKTEVSRFKRQIEEDQTFMLSKLQDKYMMSHYFEIIPLNRAVRAMQERVSDWDMSFAEFEKDFFPSEKDLRQLATERLREAYLAKEDMLVSDVTVDDVAEPEKAGDDLSTVKSVVEELARVISGSNSIKAKTTHQNLHEQPRSENAMPHGTNIQHATLANERNVEHLDLAVDNQQGTESIGARFANTTKDVQISPEQLARPFQPDEVVSDSVKISSEESNEQKFPENKSVAPTKFDRRTTSARSEIPSTAVVTRSLTSPTLPKSETSALNSSDTAAKVQGQGQKGSTQASTSSIPLPSKSSNTQKSSGAETAPQGERTNQFHRVSGSTVKSARNVAQSMIPRSINIRKFENRVSLLARHFEQMSREFEKEKIRERHQRAARTKQSQIHPTASFQPVIEVYRDADEAVTEKELMTEDEENRTVKDRRTSQPSGNVKDSQGPTTPVNRASVKRAIDAPETLREDNDKINNAVQESSAIAAEKEDVAENGVQSGEPEEEDDHHAALPDYQKELAELPKDDRSSLLKLLTSFWSERSASGWAPLEYPLSSTDHIFADSDIIVREDEPSSLIAFALASEDYISKLARFREKAVEIETHHVNGSSEEKGRSVGEDLTVERALLGKTATHMKYQFQAGSSRMQCKIFYAEAFDAIQRKCCVADRLVESLSRCLKWDSKGGRTKSLFLKTLDQRFVLKSLSPVETQAFLRFAPDYFNYMSKCLFHNLPSALAKIFGFYQVVIKNPGTGIDFNYFLLVMENVFYEGPSNRMFDLKGSMRNRRVHSTGEKDEVLLDENMLDYISQNPIYIRNHSNSFLASSISNDTLFCSKQNVMDYSLIVGLYDDRQELMVGIIDYIRTYTWDKKLESWIKDRGKHKPTVRSPKDYRNRFRASIPRYFPLAPSCWQVFGTQRTEQSPAWWESVEEPVINHNDENCEQSETSITGCTTDGKDGIDSTASRAYKHSAHSQF